MHPALILGGLGGFVALLMLGSKTASAAPAPAPTTAPNPQIPAPVNPVIRDQAAQVLKQAEAAQAVLNSTSDGWPDNFKDLSKEEQDAAVERARQAIQNIKAIWYPEVETTNPAVIAARDGSVYAAQTLIKAGSKLVNWFT